MKHLFISAIAFFLLLNHAQAYELRFDCGGDGYNSYGTQYIADQPYPGSQGAGHLGGSDVTGSRIWLTIGGVYGPDVSVHLFEKERGGQVAYRFDVPVGSYSLTLHHLEWEYHGPNLRRFDVVAEGQVLIADFDPYAHAHMLYGVGQRFLVDVTDGSLDLQLGDGIDPGTLSTVSVVTVQHDLVAPSPVTNLEAVGSYNRNILIWDRGSEEDLQGHRIYRSDSAGGPFNLLAERRDLCAFYWDDTAEPNQTRYYAVTAFDLFGNETPLGAAVPATAQDPTTSTLPVYAIEIGPADLHALRSDPGGDLYYPADFDFEDEDWSDVGVRYRGGWSRMYGKKNWKVRFDGDSFESRERLNINSEFGDYALLGHALSLRLFQSTRCMVPAARKVNLLVNGGYRGIFTEVEQIDERFLSSRGFTDFGNIYKCMSNLSLLGNYSEYEDWYEKKTNEESGVDDIIDFVELINLTPDAEFPETIAENLDVPGYLDYYAARILTGDDDFVVHNYYLYHNLDLDRWEVIPWDLDKAFRPWLHYTVINESTQDGENGGIWNHLTSRLMDVAKFRRRYCETLQSMIDFPYGESHFDAQVDSFISLIEEDQRRDVWKSRWDEADITPDGWEDTKDFRDIRTSYLLGEIDAYRSAVNGLFINELLVVNEGVLQDEGGDFDPYIELYNWSESDILLSEFALVDALGSPRRSTLPNTLLPSGEWFLLWADGETGEGDHHIDFSLDPAGGELYLYRLDDPTDPVDRCSYPALAADVAFGVYEDGWLPFKPMSPSPAASNANNEAPDFIWTAADPVEPLPGQTVTLSAQVDDDGAIDSVTLFWHITGSAHFNPVAMLDDGLHGDGGPGDGIYGGELPTQVDGTLVEYYLQASDELGLSATAPPRVPTQLFTIYFRSTNLGVFINEFMASNDSTLADPQGDFDDWVELFNQSEFELDLSGRYLSDDLQNPTKWPIPHGTTIAPRDFLIIWCDNDDGDPGLHTNFKLDADGEEIGLFDLDGTGNAPLDTLVFASQTQDISMGRFPDGQPEWRFFEDPTPGISNNVTSAVDGAPSAVGALLPPVPNPFNPITEIRFVLPDAGPTRLVVYDVNGRRVRTLVDERLEAGAHRVVWNGIDEGGNEQASGVYLFRLRSATFTAVEKAVLLR